MQRRMRRPHVWRIVLSFFFFLYRKFKLIKICLFSFFSFYLSKKKSLFIYIFLKDSSIYWSFLYIFSPCKQTCSFSKVDFGPWFAYLHVIEVALNELISHFARCNLMNATLRVYPREGGKSREAGNTTTKDKMGFCPFPQN